MLFIYFLKVLTKSVISFWSNDLSVNVCSSLLKGIEEDEERIEENEEDERIEEKDFNSDSDKWFKI